MKNHIFNDAYSAFGLSSRNLNKIVYIMEMLFMSNSEQTNKQTKMYANKTTKYESQVLPQVNTYCIMIAIELYKCNKI